jgi:hypothetical protein
MIKCELRVVVHVCKPRTQGLEQEDCWIQASLTYIVTQWL